MRRWILASFLFAAPLVTACGGDDNGDTPIDAGIDGMPPPIDAEVPDALPGRFDCLGAPLPTTAPDPIDVGGETSSVGAGGDAPLPGVAVTLYSAADEVLGTDTSDAAGLYGVAVATGGDPVDGYLHATAKGYLETYLYPPAPLAETTDQARAIMLEPATFDLLGGLALGDPPTDGLGHVLVIVLDCNDDPVQGAVVTTSPAGTVRYNSGGFPSDTATATGADGVAYVFNVAPGTVSVDASFDGMSLREHDVTARADVLTTTIVQP